MQVGDLVVRTYGEGQRPTALIVGWYKPNIPRVLWNDGQVSLETKSFLEVVKTS